MHRVVPELIVENYRSGCFRGEFPAIGMFLDLSGFSTMTDALMEHGQHGAEVLAELMHGVFNPLVESVFDYGGKIVGFAGDGIMALFPVEEDAVGVAQRALTSAFVIQQRLAQRPRHVTVYGAFPISAKIGLTSGAVSWGIVRSAEGDQATYYFRGTAVDEAASAEQYARAGEILLTQSICGLLQDAVETKPHGPFQRFQGFRVELPAAQRTTFPPVDLEVSQLFMPSEVITYDIRGEFRQVVNLFMRFPDLTEIQLETLMAHVFSLRHKYGGLLNRLDFGDKGCNLLMLWGAPVAYDNDIGRALHFLLDLKSLVDFPITSGVTYYIAHAGYLGSVMCEDYTCYGWGVNLASRFMMNAPTGEIWVDERIARRVSRRFEIEAVGAQSFKGFSAPQTVHRLRGHTRVVEPVYQGELVGRQSELEQLESFIEPLWRGRFAGLLLISGDAGIGKGRLVYEFQDSRALRDKKVLWAVCQSDQILRQSFNPLRSWLSQYFGLSSAQTLEERKQPFTAKLDGLLADVADQALVEELDRVRSVLGALLDLHWSDSLYEQLDAEERYNNTVLALIALIQAESLRQPVILLLEDLQFTDRDSREFLSRLQRAILAAGETFPIALIATMRPGRELLSPDLVTTRLPLSGLSHASLARLVETLLGGPAAPDLVSLLFERSEGNPYFVEQLLRHFQEEGYLEPSQQGWTLVKRLRANFVPGDIRAILVARLDQLARPVKTAVQTASVLGREFESRLLAHMLSGEAELSSALEEAERWGIWAPLDTLRYVFTHGLLRDAAYEMQMRSRRRELHALAVQTLESLYPEDLKTHCVELAYHAEYGELVAKARHYFALAGQTAASLYQNTQAIGYFTRALLHTPADDLVTRFELLLERVEIFNRLGDRVSQLEDLNALDRLASQLGTAREQAEVYMLFAHYHLQVGAYLAAVQDAERVAQLNQLAEEEEIILDTYRVWPLALLRLGRLEEGMNIAQQGQQLAQAYGDPVKEAYILNAMGLLAVEQNETEQAQRYLERALTLAREKADTRLESMTLVNMGTSAAYARQDYDAAREYFQASRALMRTRGERSGEAVALGNMGWAAGIGGDFEAARSFHEQALILAREVGNLYLETNTLVNLCAVSGALQQAEGAAQYGKAALELSRRTGDRSGEAWAMLYLGYASLLTDELEKAEQAFQAAIHIRSELAQVGMRMEALAGLVEVYLRKEAVAESSQCIEEILAYLQAGGTLDGAEEPLRVYYACYRSLERSRDGRATAVLGQAAELLEEQISKLRDEGSRKIYVENVPWRAAIQKAWRELHAT